MTHKTESSNSSSGTKNVLHVVSWLIWVWNQIRWCMKCFFLWRFNISLLGQLFSSPKRYENSLEHEKVQFWNLSASESQTPVVSCRRWLMRNMQRIEWWHLISSQQWNPHRSTFNGKTNLSWMKFFGTTSDSRCFMNIYRSEGNYHIFQHFTMKQLFRRHLLIFRRPTDKKLCKNFSMKWKDTLNRREKERTRYYLSSINSSNILKPACDYSPI